MTPLKEIEGYFKEYPFSKKSLEINNHTKITDLETFVNSHISILKANPGNKRYLPYYERLYKVYLICKI